MKQGPSTAQRWTQRADLRPGDARPRPCPPSCAGGKVRAAISNAVCVTEVRDGGRKARRGSAVPPAQAPSSKPLLLPRAEGISSSLTPPLESRPTLCSSATFCLIRNNAPEKTKQHGARGPGILCK